MSDLYVLQPDGTRFGPLTKDAIARGIVDGTIAQDAYLAPPGAPQWFHASQLPAVTALVESLRRTSSVPPPRPASSPPRPSSPARKAALRATLESPVSPLVKEASPRTEAQVVSAMQTQPQPAVMEQLAAMTLVSSQPPAAMRSAIEAAKAAEKKTQEARRTEAPAPETKVAPGKPAVEPARAKGPWPTWLPFGIFGAFALIALVEVVVAAAAPRADDVPGTQTVETKR